MRSWVQISSLYIKNQAWEDETDFNSGTEEAEAGQSWDRSIKHGRVPFLQDQGQNKATLQWINKCYLIKAQMYLFHLKVTFKCGDIPGMTAQGLERKAHTEPWCFLFFFFVSFHGLLTCIKRWLQNAEKVAITDSITTKGVSCQSFQFTALLIQYIQQVRSIGCIFYLPTSGNICTSVIACMSVTVLFYNIMINHCKGTIAAVTDETIKLSVNNIHQKLREEAEAVS